MTPKGSRKRVKPSPPGADSPSPASPSNAARDRSDSQPQGRAVSLRLLVSFEIEANHSFYLWQSWYPGSWSAISRVSKAAPVTEVARESISVAQNVVSTVADSSISLVDTSRQHRSPSIQLTKKVGASTRSLPADATTTRVNIVSDGSASTTALDSLEGPPAAEPSTPTKEGTGQDAAKAVEKPAEEPEAVADNLGAEPAATRPGHTEEPNGWFSWLYRTGAPEKKAASGPEPAETADRRPADQKQIIENANNRPSTQEPTEQQEPQAQEQEGTQPEAATGAPSTAQKRSWLQMWYGSATTKQGEQAPIEPSKALPADPQISKTEDVTMTPKDPPGDQGEAAGLSKTPVGTIKSSGWSFWSKDGSRTGTPENPQEVEAVEASMTPNAPARPITLEPDTEANVNITKKGSLKVKDKRAKDGAVPTVEATPPATPPPEPRPADVTASKQLQRILPNQVLPRFEDTYNLEESPSLLQSLGRLLHYTKGPEHKHVSRVKDPPRIKRALAIGVHGYFPAPLIRSVLGQPTGTSIRFSNMAAEAIRKWTADHGYTCEIEKIALEGEGRIAERVDLLWKLLLNWMEEIRKADFILVACHSQGVPVSIMLVAKLIAFGCVNASRVGVCAMAGVNMGPFSAFRSRWISGSAGELFDFEIPFSKVSKDYEAALKCALDYGVRISYIGSIDDQLVSLEVCTPVENTQSQRLTPEQSSLFSPIAHPYIFRSVFVDGRVHAPSL